MSKKSIITLSIIGLLLFGCIVTFSSYRQLYDQNVELTSKFEAQKGTVALSFDKMFKILKDQAHVTDKAAEAFKGIYVGIMEGRYSKGDGSLMKWITEQNPSFDQTIYTKLMNSIEAQREDFFLEQKKVLAIMEEHENLRNHFWSHLMLGNIPKFEYLAITSTTTENVVKTGHDDTDMFQGK